ncbi:MAG: cytochrome c oxidase accessory protein CcoG [Flavobacteriaceae bacterium]|nr:cytochrome c oxidase accessory protein CcoG [Flavobacteriaceae bacterium]
MGVQKNESFRDSIGTINKEGKRNFIFPKQPSGKFYKYRTYVSWVLLSFFVIAPFIKIRGNQFLLFNVFERKFSIFGFPFWPQDFYLLVISILVSVVFIILFTVVFGRIFCGWLCPQTIFLEMVFRKIEFLIEGDRGKQMKLHKQPWNAEKIRKRLLKWSVFYLVSFFISNIFLAYLIGSDTLLQYLAEGPIKHFGGLVKLLIFTSVFYFVFVWFREQACIIVCPYGRLQGVLLDNKTINVAYDFVRGEGENGRSPFRRKDNREELGYGDCVDCKQCVQVCPTGIDIRNGTQLECVNCTACIDACASMMEKVGFDKGLIRYASEDEIEKSEKFKFTPRMVAYSVFLTLLMSALFVMLTLRSDVQAKILRLPGQTFIREGNTIKNVFTYKLINKTVESYDDITFKVMSKKAKIIMVGEHGKLKKQGLAEGTMFIAIEKKDLTSSKEKLKIGVYSGGKLIETTSTNFMSPRK